MTTTQSTIAYNAFALSLLRAASAPDTNFVISPFSLGTALVIVHDGAKEETQKELTKLLGKNFSPSEVSDLYSSLTSTLSQKNENVVARVANRLFIDKEFTLNTAYLAHIEQAYGAGAEAINFSDGMASAALVNKFVGEKTGGKIKELVTPNSFSGAALIVNATYFNGAWLTPFKPTNTKTMEFKGIGGRREEVFMSGKDYYAPYYINNELSIVALRYKDPAYSLVVFMPSGDFGAWRSGLTAEKMRAALDNLRDGSFDLSMPKFVQQSITNGKDALQKLHVGRIFNHDADLSGISNDRNLFVSTVAHKASIEISELGTEAAASAYSEVMLCPPSRLNLDHPFIYCIMRKEMILFSGQFV